MIEPKKLSAERLEEIYRGTHRETERELLSHIAWQEQEIANLQRGCSMKLDEHDELLEERDQLRAQPLTGGGYD